MPDEAALLEAPTDVVAEIDNAVDSSAGTAEDTSVGETDSGAESTESSEASLKGSALWREVKSLEAIPPKLKAALNKVIHRSDAIETKYPDGLSAIEGQMAAVKQLVSDESMPMEQAIQEAIKERTYYHKLDNLFSDGKPEFVDELISTSPEAFQNIAPAVFRKYAEVNPEGYSAYVAQAVVQHMNSAEVPLQFRILASFLPQLPDGPAKEQVLNAVEALYSWSEGLKGMAAKKIEQKAIPNSQNGNNGEDQTAQLAQREMNVTRQEWNASIRTEGVSFVMSEAQKAAGKTALTDKEKQTVLSKVGEELEARLTADRRYGEAMQQYLKAGNRNSYIQRIQSERKKLIPGAVRRAVDDVIQARPKTAPKQAQAPVNGQKKAADPKLTGAVQFRRIAGPPRTLNMQVDLNRTTHSMLEKRQAYIKGENVPVQWGAVK